MKTKNFFLPPFLAFFILHLVPAQAQTTSPAPIYRRVSDKAAQLKRLGDSLYQAKQYEKAVVPYKAFIEQEEGKVAGMHWQAIAACYALCHQLDSSAHYMHLAADKGYDTYALLLSDTDMDNLHPHPEWKKICEKVSENRFKNMKDPIREIVLTLDTVTVNDQRVRFPLNELLQKQKKNSPEYISIQQKAQHIDSVNRAIVTRILDRYGWLGPDQIGGEGGIAIYLVVLHAPIDFQKKYYETVKAAVVKKYMPPFVLCYLDDRIAIAEGKHQVYGTQMSLYEGTSRYFILPVEDVEHLEERRTARGLPSMAEYCRWTGIEWSLDYYKKELRKVERELKRQERKKAAGH